jgi:hypothetical protein
VKRIFASIVLACAFSAGISAQLSVSEDLTGLYSYGIAGSGQSISSSSSSQPGYYYYQKNGYYLSTNITAKINVANLYDIFVKLNVRSRTGSPYIEQQLANASAQVNAISLDSAYGRVDATAALKLRLPVNVYFQLGKFAPAASNYQKVSLYGTESSLGMLKLSSDLYAGIEIARIFSTIEQMMDTSYSSLSLQAYANARIDEAIQRLYDDDGSIGSHGQGVIGSYAPQVFAALKLNGYSLPFGLLSAEAVYTLNGAGIYSGNSFGASAVLALSLLPENEDMATLTLPVSLGGAYYAKNIDLLGGTTGSDGSIVAGADTTDFRDTIKAGLGAGLKYVVPYAMAAELNLAGSYTSVQHIYRDPVSFIGASLDGKFTYLDTVFAGGGLVLGTLATAKWATKSGVTSILDDFHHSYTLADNLGWEAFVGLNAGTKCSIVLGANENKGLSMNYGLESLREGETKFRQKGSASSDYRFETFGIFLKTTFKM